MKLCIRTRGLSKVRDRGLRLDYGDLSLAPGELLAVLGPNGSGKSTLVHLLALLEEPSAGTIEYEGEDGGQPFRHVYTAAGGPAAPPGVELRGRPDLVARLRNGAFGVSLQTPYFLEPLSVLDNLTLPLLVGPSSDRAAARSRGERMLGDLGLGGKAGLSPRVLSGGQRQRLGIGRALIAGPAVVVFDEPSNCLDPAAGDAAMSWLRAYADAGHLVIVVLQRPELAAAFADRIWVVDGGLVYRPFAGDRDDAGPAAGDGRALRPALPPVPPPPGSGRRRDAETTLELAGVVARELYRPKPRPAAAGGAPPAPMAPAPPLTSPRPRAGGAPRLRLWDALRYAYRGVWERKQRPLRLGTFALLLLANAAFTLLRDGGHGMEDHLRRQLPAAGGVIQQMDVSASPLKQPHGIMTPSQVEALRALPGLEGATFYQELLRVRFTDGAGSMDETPVVSVPAGDAALRAIDGAERATASLGLIYLSGAPFAPEDDDRAGVIVTRDWLRRKYWRLDEGAADPPYPTSLEFRLRAHEGSDALPGLNGRVSVPVKGVVDHPPVVLQEQGEDVEGVYVPEGFLRRLFVWQPSWSLLYQTVDGKPLVEDYPVVTDLRVTVPGAVESRWAFQEAPKKAAALFPALAPIPAEDALLVRLAPRARQDERITPALFDDTMRAPLAAAAEAAAGRGKAVITCETAPASSLGDGLPSLDDCPRAYGRALLRFRELGDVLPAEEHVRKDLPQLDGFVRYRASIQRFQSVRFLVEKGTLGLEVAFAAGLFFVLGILVYTTTAAKSAEVGVLRLHGLRPRSVALAFGLQLALLILPACLAGTLCAFGAARGANDWVARHLLPAEEATDAAPAAPAADSAARPLVFHSLQGGGAAVAAEVGHTLALVLAILVPTNLLSLWLVRRKTIVDALRTTY